MTDLVVRGGTIDGALVDIAIDGETITEIGAELAGRPRGDRRAAGSSSCPVSSMRTFISTTRAAPSGKASRRGHARSPPEARRRVPTCRSTQAPRPSMPPRSLPRRAAAEGRIHVDVALWGGLVPGPLDRLDELAACGVVGFKAFMSSSGIDDFERVDDDALGEGMRRAAALGLPVAVHAEDEALTAALTTRARRRGPDKRARVARDAPRRGRARGHRPRALARSRDRMRTPRRPRLLRQRRGADRGGAGTRGRRDLRDLPALPRVHRLPTSRRVGALLKCAPPLRDAGERGSLLAAVRDGLVDTIGSDHSPAPASMKEADGLLLGLGRHLGMPVAALGRCSTSTSSRPRSRDSPPRLRRHASGLDGKGALVPGADADLVLVDPARPMKLQAGDLHYRHRHSPYVGRTFRHHVVRTILRGITIWDGATTRHPPAESSGARRRLAQPSTKSTETGLGNAPIASPRRSSSATACRPSSP